MKKLLFILVFTVISFITASAQTEVSIVRLDPYMTPFDTVHNIHLKQCIVCLEPYIIPFDTFKIVEIDTISQHNINTIKGIDVSIWQNDIEWKELHDDSISFVFIKATGGLKTDKNFHHNWKHCPFTKGAYHFFSPLINGTEQAKHLLKTVKLESGNLPFVIDVEYTSYYRRIHPRTAVKNLKLMLDYIEYNTGIRPIIYTSPNFWNKYFHPYFNEQEYKYKLWIATYYKKEPIIPRGWDTWTFWQYSDKGRFRNLHGCYDLNIYNGKCLNDVIIK